MTDIERKGGVMNGRWIIPALIVSVTIVALVVGKRSFGGTTDNDPVEPEEESYYGIFPFEVPGELNFAGERVPLEYFDVNESMDMELLSNTFFHSQTIRMIKLANRYFPQIEPILEEHGIPADFKYLAIAESNLSNAVSPAGAVGFWQITRGTASDYGLEVNNEVDERYHLEKSTVVACEYLLESYEKYGNWTMAAASYNVGRRGIDRQVTRQKVDDYYDLLLNQETARYIFRILAFKLILEDPAAYGFHLSQKDLYQPVPFHTVVVDGPVTDFADFAKEHGTNYKLLKFLNPWLRDNNLTNSRKTEYQVKIPENGARSAY